jgi:elongation factor G
MSTALDALRNVAFVGHPSSGKTTLVDAMAFLLGASARKGNVADKTSICDFEPEEQDKGHTLQMAVVQAQRDGVSWTLMDTPGYPDFISDTNSAMFAADLVVGVVSAAGPVTYNLRKKLEAAAQLGRGRAIVVTHVDADNCDFDKTVAELREKVGQICVPLMVPDASGPAFSSVHSVVQDEGSDWRKRLMDRTMDGSEDDALLEHYLETEVLTTEELAASVPAAIAKGALVPILAVNAASGVGVAEMIEALTSYAPNPLLDHTLDSEGNELAHDEKGALVGTVFNVRSDPHVGRICVARIHRGVLGAHDSVIGPTSGDKTEKLGGLFRLVGKKREPLDNAGPGEIVAFTKVEHVHYGEEFAHRAEDLVNVALPPQPGAMVALTVLPKTRADEQKLGEALHKLEAEDPTLRTQFDKETHEMVVHGMSDLHLQIMQSRLKRRYGVEITTHIPTIAYRETISRPADGHYRHKKQSGGRGQFAECRVRVKPLAKGSGVTFSDGIVGGSIPRNLIPAVEKGMRELTSQGVLTHSQVIDLDFEVYDGKFHDVDSDEASFKVAGSKAFMDAFLKASPVLLEPVMEMVVSAPTDSAGAIFSDLTSHRRAHVVDQWTEADGGVTVIKAHVPLSTSQTYQRDLKSQTAGEGSYSMVFHDYQPMPAGEQAKVLAKIGRKHAEES